MKITVNQRTVEDLTPGQRFTHPSGSEYMKTTDGRAVNLTTGGYTVGTAAHVNEEVELGELHNDDWFMLDGRLGHVVNNNTKAKTVVVYNGPDRRKEMERETLVLKVHKLTVEV